VVALMSAEERHKPRIRRAPVLAEVGAIYSHRIGTKLGACQVLSVRREEAGEAFAALARDMGIDAEVSATWFDASRDF
jgi:hypothetical protein